jgi:hypothetical protein
MKAKVVMKAVRMWKRRLFYIMLERVRMRLGQGELRTYGWNTVGHRVEG